MSQLIDSKYYVRDHKRDYYYIDYRYKDDNSNMNDEPHIPLWFQIKMDFDVIGFSQHDYYTAFLTKKGIIILTDEYEETSSSTQNQEIHIYDDSISHVARSIIKIEPVTPFIDVSCGRMHIMMVKADGSLWGIGSNSHGQLGLGYITENISFYEACKIENMDRVVSVRCGQYCTAIIKNDGSLWMTGYDSVNSYLCNREFEKVIIPNNDNSPIIDIYFSEKCIYLIKLNGSVWFCGSHPLNPSIHSKTFALLTCITNVLTLKQTRDYIAILKKDHSLWVLGHNKDGQLGIHHNNHNTSFVCVDDLGNDVYDMACHPHFIIVLKKDGTLWSSGDMSNVHAKHFYEPKSRHFVYRNHINTFIK
jgi:alpha-tubulin suppressor-like RCC1 family protein